ncbi:MAG: hypothetical protein QHH00_03025 [Methanomassiliicoccales archaeon]|nr:hypothetical protein [Methanomassiliicoccales archaeon]
MTGDHQGEELLEFDSRVADWMRNHTIGDLKRLAQEMELSGIDAREVWGFIDDLLPVAMSMTGNLPETTNIDLEEFVLALP